MFQRFTSLFFNDSSSGEVVEEPKPFVSKEEEEDGWLIIDLPDSLASSLGTQQWVGEKDSVCASRCRHGSLPPTTSSPYSLSDCVSRSMPSQPDPCLMDESWFVTPPPCFTAEGPDPVSMESSPMEDLLIEHPSMSVYVTTTSSIIMEREDPEENIQENEIPENCLQRRPPHHSTSLATKTAILEKVNQVRRIQRAKQLAEKHKFSQKVMKRQNRARECRPQRAKPQGHFVYQPCQRQYNY